jgi:putative ABC transport system substrate-binding protein
MLITAVTDPVSAGLVASLDAPNGTNTGTHDMNPVAEQIALVLDLVPGATKVGILYTASEDNSQIQASMAASAAEVLGLTVEIRTVTSAGEIQQAMTSLANAGINALYLPTDNLLASSMEIVNTRATELQLPVVCGESSMAEKAERNIRHQLL